MPTLFNQTILPVYHLKALKIFFMKTVLLSILFTLYYQTIKKFNDNLKQTLIGFKIILKKHTMILKRRKKKKDAIMKKTNKTPLSFISLKHIY